MVVLPRHYFQLAERLRIGIEASQNIPCEW